MRSSSSLRTVVVVVVLVVVVALAALTVVSGAVGEPSLPAAGAGRLRVDGWPAAAERTITNGSARIDAVYEPASGPPVRVTGVTSFAGPETEVAAGIDGDAPAQVRVTSAGAWVRVPGAETWVALPPAGPGSASITDGRGWGERLSTLDPSSEVWVDDAGRVVRVRMPRDARGGRLDVRFSSFGTDVRIEPP